MNFVPGVAYHFCLNLSAAFSQPGNGLIVEPCRHLTSSNLNTSNSDVAIPGLEPVLVPDFEVFSENCDYNSNSGSIRC